MTTKAEGEGAAIAAPSPFVVPSVLRELFERSIGTVGITVRSSQARSAPIRAATSAGESSSVPTAAVVPRDLGLVTDEPLVSTDLRGTNYSSVFSAMDTLVIGNMVTVVAWYDNDWGYACRTADLTALVAQSL